jgi:delta 1-pyrroline-5-carboxylate dehydrogenase
MTGSGVIASEANESRDRKAPVIVIHSLAHAIAALKAAVQAGRSVVLASAPGAASYVGPGWFRELVAAAREAVPEASCSSLLDCGDNRGATLAALRSEVEGVVFTGRADVARRLADIASQYRVRFVAKRPVPALDLGEDFFAAPEILERRCVKLLS